MHPVPAIGRRVQSLEWLQKAAPHVAGWSFLVLCTAWYLREAVVNQLPNDSPSDLLWYYEAARHVIQGRSPFNAEGYIYPPLLAYLLSPLALLDYLTARWVWFLFSHVCLLVAGYLLWRRIGRDWTTACVIATIWACGGAAGESLALGQLGPLLTLLLVLAYSWDGWGGGVALAVGSALKVIPGVLAVALVLRRAWRESAVVLIGSALLLVVPWFVVWCCLSGPPAPPHLHFLAGTPGVLSWSVPSIVLRILNPPQPGISLPSVWLHGHELHVLQLPVQQRWPGVVTSLLTFFAGAGALVYAVRGRLSATQVPLAAAALIALGLVAAPVCWAHYQVMNYPGIALFVCHALRFRLWKTFAAAAGCAMCLYPLPVSILRGYYYGNGGAWPNLPAVIYFWTSISAAAALVLFSLMVRELKRL